MWFAVRDGGGSLDVVASAVPAIAFAAFIAGMLLLGFHRFVAASTALSLSLVGLVAIVEPRLPRRTAVPSPGITVVSDNVLRNSRWPGPAADLMTSQGADVVVSVEMGTSYVAHMDEHTDRYPYAAVSEEQGVWSRWPIELLPPVDGLAPSRIARVAVDADWGRFIVYAIHLYNPLHESTLADQQRLLDELIAAADAESDPVIMAGDFNMSDRTSGYRELEGQMRDAMRTGWWAASTYRHGVWRALSLRIDQLFVPQAWCAAGATTFRVPGSDHIAIQATVGPCPS